ncbi:hypothetical protein ABZ890_38395 [Streptomyces sp. NPDC046984]|uniref:hypothetical protein n=1 Tax=Streptomyces sp. NPDC046984 TaxID=3155138 RepID=UPI0033D034FD
MGEEAVDAEVGGGRCLRAPESARRDRTASVHALLSGDSEAGQWKAAVRTET